MMKNLESNEQARFVKDLVCSGILVRASLPRNNLLSIDFPAYTIFLIAEDYPAKTSVMWNSAYKELGIDAGNITFIVNPKDLKFVLEGFRQDSKYHGGSIGVGLKDEIIQYLDELDPMVQTIRAVNFILKTSNNKLKGYNTDSFGYALGLKDKFAEKGEKLEGKKVVVLGAGGAGNAVAFALTGEGMKVIITNRTVEKAEKLAHVINKHFNLEKEKAVRFGGEDIIASEVLDADVVVNVSTKGADGEFSSFMPLATAESGKLEENLKISKQILETIPKQAVISDIVLRKEITPFLKTAKEAGYEILDGISMVVYQAVEAFWIIYGSRLEAKGRTKADVLRVMKKAAGLE